LRVSAVAACCFRASASSPLASSSSLVSSWILRSAEARSSVGEAVMTTRASLQLARATLDRPHSVREKCYAIWRLDGMYRSGQTQDPVSPHWVVPPLAFGRYPDGLWLLPGANNRSVRRIGNRGNQQPSSQHSSSSARGDAYAHSQRRMFLRSS